MGWWNAEINQATGLPFTDAEYKANVAALTAKQGKLFDFMASKEMDNPEGDPAKYKQRLIEMAAILGPPPDGADANALASWVNKFKSLRYNRLGNVKLKAEREAAGWTDEKYRADPKGYYAWLKSHMASMGESTSGAIWDDWSAEDIAESVRVGESDSPGSMSGASEAEAVAPSADDRLAEYYKALYSAGDEKRLGDMASSQAARGSYAAGVRGGAMGQGISQAAADAGFKYRQNTNAQALQYMGMDQGVQMHADSLAAQAEQFNAQQKAMAAQQSFLQRQQTGGLIGGIIGTGIGAIAQAAGLPGGAQIGGALGGGIGSMAGGGQSPGAYTVKGYGSLAKNGATKPSSSGGGNV